MIHLKHLELMIITTDQVSNDHGALRKRFIGYIPGVTNIDTLGEELNSSRRFITTFDDDGRTAFYSKSHVAAVIPNQETTDAD